jgi:hypothetical protein
MALFGSVSLLFAPECLASVAESPAALPAPKASPPELIVSAAVAAGYSFSDRRKRAPEPAKEQKPKSTCL